MDGSITSLIIWASSTLNIVLFSPEGHVLHSNAAAGLLTIQNELGLPEVVTVDANTQFFIRTPENAISDTTPIGTGPAFLANVERGFKVHVSPSDPAAAPMIADTVDIEIARYDGSISNANANNFTYTHKFRTVGDNYTFTLPYVSSSTANANGVTGFEWWNFAFPTIVDSGANAVSDFMNVTNGDANFGGTVGPLTAYGATYAIWNDPAAKNSWAAPWVVLEPTDVPFGVAATAYSNGSFAMTVPGGTNAVTVVLNTNPGSAPLIYQVDRTNGIITISPVDISTTAGQNTLLTNLVAGTPAKVFGVPQTAGSLNGYVLVYFTGTLPSSVD